MTLKASRRILGTGCMAAAVSHKRIQVQWDRCFSGFTHCCGTAQQKSHKTSCTDGSQSMPDSACEWPISDHDTHSALCSYAAFDHAMLPVYHDRQTYWLTRTRSLSRAVEQ